MAALHHVLGILPLHGPLTASEVLGVIDRLEHAGSIELVDAVVAVRADDGTIRIGARSPSAHLELDLAAWRWLIGETLSPSPGRSGLGDSFLAEVRDVLVDAHGWLALVFSRLDVDAALGELRPFPAARLVYGALPQEMFERMRGWPVAPARRRRHAIPS